MVTDGLGCTGTAQGSITVNPLPIADAGVDVEICATSSTTLTATGGTSYLWSNGATTAATTVTPSVSTTYAVTVTDANGCTDTDDVVVTVNPLPNVNAGVDQSICLNINATITAVATGGTGVLAYAWDNGLPAQTSHTVSPTVSTVYHVTVTDSKSCTATDAVAVNLLSPLNVSVNSPAVCVGNSATIKATVTNGDGNNTYAWDNGLPNQATHTLTNAVGTTTYHVMVIDGLGCTGSAQGSITVNPLPIADAGQDVEICATASTTLTATGGTSYLWSNGATTASTTVTPSVSTTYTVTVTDANGCTDTDDVVVTVNPLPDFILTIPIACPGTTAEVNITGLTNAVAATAQLKIDAGAYTAYPNPAILTGLSVGSHTIIVKNTNGCERAKSINVSPVPAVLCLPVGVVRSN